MLALCDALKLVFTSYIPVVGTVPKHSTTSVSCCKGVFKALLFFSRFAAILLMIMWYFQTQRLICRHFKRAKTQPARQHGIYSDA